MRTNIARAAATAVALGALCLSTSGNAGEKDFLSRFHGSFSGGGTVIRNAEAGPGKVTCNLNGQSSASGISISGQCQMAGFGRQIRADLRYDPTSGRYSGTYIGSAIGAASLSGKRRGDSVVLTITWPRPVNGDTHATMTIRNSGDGRLAITVTDELTPGAGRSKVTQLALNQS
jgi:hypothetical protein